MIKLRGIIYLMNNVDEVYKYEYLLKIKCSPSASFREHDRFVREQNMSVK